MAFELILGGIGIATEAISTIGSFAQAAEQNKKFREAEEAAAAAMIEARKRLEVNVYKGLGIQQESFDLARRELLSQGALATDALREGDARSLAAGVGRVQLAQQAGQEKVATAMQQEKAQLDKLIAAEEGRLADIGSQLDLQEAIGAQEAAADAQKAQAQAIQQGFAGVTRLGGRIAAMPGLFGKTPEARAAAGINRDLKQKLNKEQRAERKELRKDFKEQLRDTPREDRKDLRKQFRDDMTDLRETQSSVKANTLKSILSNVDISTLDLSDAAKSILVDPSNKDRLRNPSELSENEFKAFTASLSLPVLQGIRELVGLEVSTRGRNPDPSDVFYETIIQNPLFSIDPATGLPFNPNQSQMTYGFGGGQTPTSQLLPQLGPSYIGMPGSIYYGKEPGPVNNIFDPFNIYTK
tara:strand:- start:16314 stop:17549 length:1236 start_codon:yes stop_codon:yes gene_type:complete